MKHTKPLGKPRPVPAGENDIFCQLALVLSALGVEVPKEIFTKCLGINDN